MKSRSRPVFGNIAAAVLAAMTIWVFFRLQYSGPESAIVRFNDIIRQMPDYRPAGDERLRGRVLDESIVNFYRALGDSGLAEMQNVAIGVVPTADVRRPSDEVIRMLVHIKDWCDQGATMDLGWMDRGADRVRAYVYYNFPAPNPGGMETKMGMVWVVVRKGKSWYVDANQTAVILADNDPS